MPTFVRNMEKVLAQSVSVDGAVSLQSSACVTLVHSAKASHRAAIA